MKNKVIAWGRDDFNMLGLIRELGQSGLDLLFLSYGKTKIYRIFLKLKAQTKPFVSFFS